MQAVRRKETIPVAFSRVCCGREAYVVTVLFPLFVGIVTVANLVEANKRVPQWSKIALSVCKV